MKRIVTKGFQKNTLAFFSFYLYKVATTRGSPFGISRDIYRGGTPVRVDYIIAVVCLYMPLLLSLISFQLFW
jgi:hypothetical protein